jgi:hypothetical protein
MGRKRVMSYEELAQGVRLKLALAANDPAITVAGYSRSNVIPHAAGATILLTVRDPKTGLFKVTLRATTHTASEVTLALNTSR